ncbi:MAG: glycosyltransferase [Chlorobium sp.]|nr:glycosyltransferase [Chlorobium sp.]
MIKIAFVIDTIESPTAGTEKQLLMLLKYLDRSKFQPYLCVLRSSQWTKTHFAECELIDIGFLSFGKLHSYLNLIKFSAWMRRERIDIVQTHFAEGNKVGIIAARLAGCKKIISTRRNQGYWHNRFELLLLATLNKWVACFLANSGNTREWVALAEGISPNRIKVIYNSLEIDIFSKGSDGERLAFRKQLDFPSEAIIVGVVANLRPVKAIDVFILAAARVLEQLPQVRFVVVGAGPEKEKLEALCDDLGIKSFIRFLGECLDVPSILSCIDIGVLSSSSESFSNAIVEYMAAGLAVVCTNVGGAREAIEDGFNGFVVEAGDFEKIAECIAVIIEKDLFLDMGRRGKGKAERLFSHKEVIAHYQQIYEEIA